MNTLEKKENLTAGYAAVQCFYWMAFGGMVGFISVYLLDRGYTNTQIGILIAVAGTFSAILQPMLAGYADRAKSLSLKKIILITLGIQLAFGILLLATYRSSFLLTGVFYACCMMIGQVLTPLVNALGMESINQGKKLNFGIARGMGSGGYAFVVYVIGIAVGRMGAVSVPIAMILITGGLMISILLFPFQKQQKEQTEETKQEEGSRAEGRNPFLFFLKYKRFSITLAGCVLVYISHVLLNSFTFQIVESKGGGSPEMGTAMAIASLVELPTMFLFGFMLKKIRCDIWFRISGIFFFLKSLGTLIAPGMRTFYGVQFFQMLGWGLIIVSSVYYVNSIMEKEDVIKGQAYMTMTYTLGSVVGALLGGALIDSMGVPSMLIFATCSAAAGMVIMLLSTQRAKSEEIKCEKSA